MDNSPVEDEDTVNMLKLQLKRKEVLVEQMSKALELQSARHLALFNILKGHLDTNAADALHVFQTLVEQNTTQHQEINVNTQLLRHIENERDAYREEVVNLSAKLLEQMSVYEEKIEMLQFHQDTIELENRALTRRMHNQLATDTESELDMLTDQPPFTYTEKQRIKKLKEMHCNVNSLNEIVEKLQMGEQPCLSLFTSLNELEVQVEEEDDPDQILAEISDSVQSLKSMIHDLYFNSVDSSVLESCTHQ